jgi:hypothetical protein
MPVSREIVFWVGDPLPGDFASEVFAGFTFDEIRSDLELLFQLEDPFDVLVNGQPTSRKDQQLDYGDEVRILLHSAAGRDREDDGATAEAMPQVVAPLSIDLQTAEAMTQVVAPLSIDLQTNEATVKGGKTYHLDRVLILILDVLIRARGNFVSRQQMRRAHKGLQEEAHLERHISRMPPAILDSIERKTRQGYRIAWVQKG